MGQKAAREVAPQGAASNAEAVEEAKKKVNAMNAKELRVYLGKHGVDTSRCVEKSDLVDLAMKVAEKAKKGSSMDTPEPPKPPKGEFLCCFNWLLPEKAPDWYAAKIGHGGSGKDIHDKPAPAGSLFGIGFVSMSVKDGPLARTFYETGMGFNPSSRGKNNEVWLNAGPSQIQIKIDPNKESDRWPGEIRVWVDNIQTTYDHMAVTDGELHIKHVCEYMHGINGGEFSIKIIDPFLKTFYIMTEAPKGRKELIHKIGGESSSMKANVLALSDLSIKCKSRADTQLFGEFYKQFFGAAITVQQYETMVHFSPGKDLHQTLTFKEDTPVPPATDLATFCFYMASLQDLHKAFTKCKGAGIVESPSTWEQAEKAHEFIIKGMVDPNTSRMLLPMRNIVRAASHPECLVYK